jgi:hypothetical protein
MYLSADCIPATVGLYENHTTGNEDEGGLLILTRRGMIENERYASSNRKLNRSKRRVILQSVFNFFEGGE